MMLLSRPEKEKMVLELYSQGKTYRQIASNVRISPRDIGLILKKAAGEEKDEEKEANKQNENYNNNKNSLSTRAYELFSEGKNLVEVAIELNLREADVAKYYKEFLKLNGWNKLARIHQELKGNIDPFVKLYRLCEIEGMGPQDVIKLLDTANNKNGRGLKAIENRCQSLKEEINSLELVRLDLNRELRNLQDQIKALTRVVNSLQLDSKEEQRKLIWLLEEKKALQNLVEHIKNNDKEYEKIKHTLEEKANDFLSDKRALLKLALTSLIRTIQSDPEKFNYIVNGMSTTAAATARSSISGQFYYLLPQKQKNEIDEMYKRLLIDEAEKIYQELLNYLTDSTMVEAAFSV